MKPNNPEATVKALLAEQLGVETEDLKDEDYLDEDLHMGPVEISDFVAKLQATGLDISELENPTELSVGEIVEILSAHNIE
jgi:hypothetical protein